MTDVTSADRPFRSLGEPVHRLRLIFARLDVEATGIRLLATGLVLGVATESTTAGGNGF